MSRNAKAFDNEYGYKTVAAKSSDVIYKYSLKGRSQVGFLRRFANSWFVNTVVEIYIDGQLFQKLERQLGDGIEDPHTFSPPVVFRNSIKVFVINNDTSPHVFEALCEGMVYNEK